MKMLRILEMSWLIIAILGVIFGIYKCLTSGINEALFIFGISLIAVIFFVMRRKQRIGMEKHEQK
jgi:hypothetical protein